MIIMSELDELNLRYRKVIEYTKNLRKDLDDKLQQEFGDNSWAKEEAKSAKYHNDVENIQRCLEYSKKVYDKIEEIKLNMEGIDKDKTKLQIKLTEQLFKETRKNNVQYTGEAVLYKKYELTQNTFNHDKSRIITESMTSPIAMLYNFSKFNGDNVVMINPLSINRGGCVMHGQRGIEEDLCLQTNYWKVLGKFIKDDKYQIDSIGDMIYAPKVVRLRDGNFKWLTKEQRSYANMIGVKFPYRLDPLMDTGRAVYEHDIDRKIIHDTLDKVFSLCVDRGHDSILFNNIGTGSISYPEDEFIDIIREKIHKYKFKIFVFCGYSGDIDGTDKLDRLKWIKYCKNLDNGTDYSKRRDVQEPIYVDLLPSIEKEEDNKADDSGNESG